MRTLERWLLGVLVATAALGQGVGSQPKPVVEPVGDVRELSRFSFRVTTPAVSLAEGPAGEGWTSIRVQGFGTRERRPGAPDLPAHTFLVALPEGAVPRLEVEPLAVRLLPGVRPRPVPHARVTVEEDEGAGRKVARSEELAADAALYAQPPPAVRLGEIGYLRDQRYVEVIVTPVRPRTGRPGEDALEVWDRFQVTVAFDGVDGLQGEARPDPRHEDTYREAFVNYAQGLLFRRTASAPDAPLASAALLAGPRYEIRVRQTGVVRLDVARLTGTGFLAEPLSTWRLRARGADVPLHVHDTNLNGVLDGGEWVQFWGQALDEEPKVVLDTDVPGDVDLWALNDATDDNVYLMTAEPGTHARMAARPSAPTFTRVPPTDFQAVARQEVDDSWRPLGSADPWSWMPLLQTGTATTQRTDDVPLPGLAGAGSPVSVTVALKGTTENPGLAPDHHTRITLLTGGNTVLAQQDDDGTFDGRETHTQSFPWAGGSVTNPVRVRTEARPIDAGNHGVVLDWIEVGYRRTFAAAGDGLFFTWPNEDAEFVVSNLASPAAAIAVYEVTAAPDTIAAAVRLSGVSVTGAGPFSVRFRVDKDPGLPDLAPREFVVAGSGAAVIPQTADFTADTVSDLRDPAIQADVVVIAHPSVLDQGAGSPLSLLLGLRAARGLSSKVARMDDVQDEFNDGIAGPEAIKRFLAWVMSPQGWAQPKPAYVLLLGDGSYDLKAGTVNGNLVPTQIVFKDDPALGYYASDNLLAAVVGDDAMPDLAVGRLPARTLAEANVMLQKILDYEQAAPAGAWRRHALFVSDRGKNFSAAEALTFEGTNAAAQSAMKIPPHSATQLRYWTDYGGNGPNEIQADIEDAINGTLVPGVDGAAVLQYIGHGNFDLWSDDIVFHRNDVAALTNGGRLPWLLAHNCLTSGFHSTAPVTIGEAFLTKAGGGALAVFSPSGLSFNYFGDLVSADVFDALYGPRKERGMAAAVTDSLVTLCGQGSVEPCEGYVLLGDPATQLALPTVQPPGIPTATPLNARVDLSWSASATPGALYDVWRTQNLGPMGSYTRINGAPLAGTTFSDTTVSNAQTYFYYVVARDVSGFESRWSNFNSDCAVDGPDCVEARPLNPNAPASPTGLTVTDHETGGRLDLAWNASAETDLKEYTVCWGTAPGSHPNCFSAAKLTSWVLTGMTNGVVHYVVVKATNTSNVTSAPSPEVSETPTFVRGVRSPAFIGSLRVSRAASDLLLTWDPVTTDLYGKPETAVTYQVYRGTTPGFDPSLAAPISPVNLVTPAFTDVGAAAPGAPVYYYLVRAVDAEGNPGGLGRQLPNGIDVLTVDKSLITPGNLVLSWPAVTTDFDGRPARIREYRVYARATPFTRSEIGGMSVLTSTAGTQVEVTPPGGIQYYSVLVVDERGNLSSF